MSDLELIQNLDESLFEPHDDTAIGGSESFYTEPLNHEAAEALLGDKFRPTCKYYIIFDIDTTVVVQINPNYPKDQPDTCDASGRVVDGRRVEYTLMPKDVQTYADMLVSTHKTVGPIESSTKETIMGLKTRNTWVILEILVILVVIALWVIMALYFLK